MSMDGHARTGDLQAVYAAESQEDIVSFSRAEKTILFQALMDVILEYRSRLRIFSPLCSLLALVRQYDGRADASVYACRGGVDFFFIDARNGATYPCGFRGKEDLGGYPRADFGAVETVRSCRRCDWECFRDPSQLLGPFLELFEKPAALVGKLLADAQLRRYWLADLKYYRACDYFNGRMPPNPRRLLAFEPDRSRAAFAGVGAAGCRYNSSS